MEYEKHFALSTHLIQVAKKENLTLDEFILLIYFEDSLDKTFNIELIKTATNLTENEILTSFTTLIKKNLLNVESATDLEGKRQEKISLKPIYDQLKEQEIKEEEEEKKINIYEAFENEFGRAISSIEYEIIGAWIEKGWKEELILGALKEAVYNGVTNLRYIDKILYEWQKKGYKTMQEVKKGLVKKEETKSEPLFDYNWLDENEDE